MSGSIALTILTGADWGVQISWTDSTGAAIPFSNATMDIRQELAPTGQLIAQLDGSGTLDGLIQIPSDGVLIMSMPATRTKTLQTGQGFWDLFVTTGGVRARLAFGTVRIQQHVTAVPV